MGLLQWWYDFLPRIIQEHWIGHTKLENIQEFYAIYKKKAKILFNIYFFRTIF